MAELRGLHQRLESALGRLDSAVEARVTSADSQERIDLLTRDLDLAAAENAKLHATTDTVARRLDDVIGRIRQILGEEADDI